MRQEKREIKALWMTVAVCLLLAVLDMVFFAGRYKLITLTAGLAMVGLLLLSELVPLWNVSTLTLMAYVLFTGISILWAMAGKFFLREYAKVFTATLVFLATVLLRRKEPMFEKRLCSVLAGVSGLFALAHVEAASTGLLASLLKRVPAFAELFVGFEAGTRLTGIFGNANVASSVLALGIFFSLALLCAERDRMWRGFYAVTLACNAFAMLLAFSMGALACFAVSIVFYLVFAGEGRGAALFRMLEAAVPTLVCAFAAFPCFNHEGAARAVPLLLLVADAAAVSALELGLADRVTAAFEKRHRAVLLALVVVLGLAVVYVAAGSSVSGPYTFGEPLRRSLYPAGGEHSLQIEANGDVSVTVTSQNRAQTMMHTQTVLYSGPATEAVFTVPEDSEVCYFDFSGAEGTTLSEASVDGEPIRLDYKLLPGFVANRLQGLRANQNAIQRGVFMADGLKLFRLSPVVGHGIGAFETGVSRVQDFYYETRYVHNHYIQVLLEGGVIGLALWCAAMASLLVALWRRRSGAAEQNARWLYAALWASMVMILTHSFVEVSMSFIVFELFAYAVFGLIVRTCEQPLPAQAQAAPEMDAQKKKKGAKVAEKKAGDSLVNLVCAALPALFLMTLIGNLWAQHLVNTKVSSYNAFYNNLERAAKIDAYEHNSTLLSYVAAVAEQGDTGHLDRANEFAAQLSKAQSNAVPEILVYYYLSTEQFIEAIDAAELGAVYSASDPSVWNNCVTNLRAAFLDTGEYSALLTDQGDAIRDKLREYYGMLVERNETAMEPIVLSQENAAFFDTVLGS